MGKYIINGGNNLKGEVFISGAKNSVLPILASTVLNSGITVLKNVPMISDTLVSIDILRDLGCEVNIGENTVFIDSKDMNKTLVKEDLVKKMRSSIIFLGSILARFKEANICYPGGCNLGKRPIDFHLSSFEKMGINIEEDKNIIKADAKSIKPTIIRLPFASVGATQNIILASIFVDGEIMIYNAAKEPEIIDMQRFLNEMGANISGAGSDKIIIKGVKSLNKFVEYTIMPDRIEAGTFLCMAALNKGNIKVNNIFPNHLNALIDVLQKVGCEMNVSKNSIFLKAPDKIMPIDFLETNPYPFFPTDLQPQIMSVLAIAKGESVIKENIFEARNKHVHELNKMGCNIIIEDNNTFIVKGVEEIKPCEVFANDLRGGACLILATLFAKGESIINGSVHIERGYEKIEEKLTLIGANIKKYTED